MLQNLPALEFGILIMKAAKKRNHLRRHMPASEPALERQGAPPGLGTKKVGEDGESKTSIEGYDR